MIAQNSPFEQRNVQRQRTRRDQTPELSRIEMSKPRTIARKLNHFADFSPPDRQKSERVVRRVDADQIRFSVPVQIRDDREQRQRTDRKPKHHSERPIADSRKQNHLTLKKIRYHN